MRKQLRDILFPLCTTQMAFYERRKEMYKRNINARNNQIQLSSFIDLIAEEGISFHHYIDLSSKFVSQYSFAVHIVWMEKNICSLRSRYKEEQRSTRIAIFPDSVGSQVNIAPTQKFEQIRKENKVSFSFNYFISMHFHWSLFLYILLLFLFLFRIEYLFLISFYM